jgi:hypothetical protein
MYFVEHKVALEVTCIFPYGETAVRLVPATRDPADWVGRQAFGTFPRQQREV